MDRCKDCIHERICKLWSDQECQNASCFCDDCFELKREPEKHAHWIDITQPKYICHSYRCSACNRASLTNFFEYCPHCGAKMDKEV